MPAPISTTSSQEASTTSPTATTSGTPTTPSPVATISETQQPTIVPTDTATKDYIDLVNRVGRTISIGIQEIIDTRSTKKLIQQDCTNIRSLCSEAATASPPQGFKAFHALLIEGCRRYSWGAETMLKAIDANDQAGIAEAENLMDGGYDYFYQARQLATELTPSLAGIASFKGLREEAQRQAEAQAEREAQQKQAEEFAAQQKVPPIEIYSAWIEKNIIGTPEAHLRARNTSQRTIDAYEVLLSFYDRFDREVKEFNSTYGTNQMRGTIQKTLQSGDTYDCYWNLAVYDLTTRFTVRLYQVHFTDGTTWKENSPEVVGVLNE
jgi:hypothetical protein